MQWNARNGSFFNFRTYHSSSPPCSRAWRSCFSVCGQDPRSLYQHWGFGNGEVQAPWSEREEGKGRSHLLTSNSIRQPDSTHERNETSPFPTWTHPSTSNLWHDCYWFFVARVLLAICGTGIIGWLASQPASQPASHY